MGKKTPVIVLHGWGSSPDRWKPVFTNNSYLDIRIPYLPGFNPKQPLKKPFSIEDYSAWLNRYIIKRNIEKPIIIGHSHGGRIAIHYCSHYNNASKLVLIDAAGILPNNTIKKIIFKLLASMGKSILQIVPNKKITAIGQKILYKLARESDYLNANEVMKKTMQNMLAYDATPDLPKIAAPTLCIWGKNDKATPLWMGKFAQKILNAKLVTIDAGHSPHITHPKKLAKIILGFIS